MKVDKNSKKPRGEFTVIGHASYKDGKIAYPNKPKSLWDELF